jgi:hypothetical protein
MWEHVQKLEKHFRAGAQLLKDGFAVRRKYLVFDWDSFVGLLYAMSCIECLGVTIAGSFASSFLLPAQSHNLTSRLPFIRQLYTRPNAPPSNAVSGT